MDFRPYFFACFALFAISCSSKQELVVLERDMTRVPDTRITLVNGDYVPLESYLDRPTVIMFWATWCSGSRGDIDDYAELMERYSSFQFMTVSLDGSGDNAEVNHYLEKNGLRNIINAHSGNKFDDEAVISFGVREIPYYFFIDRSGEILFRGDDIDDLEDSFVTFS